MCSSPTGSHMNKIPSIPNRSVRTHRPVLIIQGFSCVTKRHYFPILCLRSGQTPGPAVQLICVPGASAKYRRAKIRSKHNTVRICLFPGYQFIAVIQIVLTDIIPIIPHGKQSASFKRSDPSCDQFSCSTTFCKGIPLRITTVNFHRQQCDNQKNCNQYAHCDQYGFLHQNPSPGLVLRTLHFIKTGTADNCAGQLSDKFCLLFCNVYHAAGVGTHMAADGSTHIDNLLIRDIITHGA